MLIFYASSPISPAREDAPIERGSRRETEQFRASQTAARDRMTLWFLSLSLVPFAGTLLCAELQRLSYVFFIGLVAGFLAFYSYGFHGFYTWIWRLPAGGTTGPFKGWHRMLTGWDISSWIWASILYYYQHDSPEYYLSGNSLDAAVGCVSHLYSVVPERLHDRRIVEDWKSGTLPWINHWYSII